MDIRHFSLDIRTTSWAQKGKTLALLVFFITILASCSKTPTLPTAQPITSIRVVMDNNYPPYAFLDERGTMQGILIDQWNAWEQHTGVQVEIVGLAWDDALTGMENGEYDVIDTIFYTEERSKIYDFTEAYADINVRIFFPITVSGIADADSLQGFRVAVKSGDANAEYLLDHGVTSLAYYNSYETIVRAAAEKKETIFVIDEPPALYFLHKYGVQDQFNYSEPLYGGAFHRAVKKGDTATLDLVKNGFAMISDAEYRAIDTRWFGSRQLSDFNRFIPYLGAGASAALIVISILIIFNRTLQHRIKLRTQELEDALHHLNENRIFLAELIENSGALIFVKDRSRRYELVNRKFEEVTSLNRDIVIGKTDEELFSELDGVQFRTNDDKVMGSGNVAEFEEVLNTPQGRQHFLSIKFPLHDESGSVKGLCGMSTDITERKQAEDALRENEMIFASFLEYSPVYIFFKDKDIRSVRLSKNYEKMLGMPISQILGKTMDELFPSDLAKSMVKDDLQILNQGQRVNIVEEFDGHIYETTKFPIYKDGKPHMLAGFTLDITERKQAELEREKLIAELSAKNTELETFTYTVSHDLKSPLVTIRGFLGYLSEDALKGDIPRTKKDIKHIENATEKMQELLQDLLELSRIGRIMNTPETVQFEDLLNDALDIVRGQLETRQVTIQTQPSLPAVHGDRQRLTEVLQNLLDNSIKYMGDQPAPRIEIGQQGETNGMPIFFIRDNGIGIDPEHHERIFGLFNKLDIKSEGTGIGLALVKRIIEVHGGTIWIESELQKGATFYFSLPTHPLAEQGKI